MLLPLYLNLPASSTEEDRIPVQVFLPERPELVLSVDREWPVVMTVES